MIWALALLHCDAGILQVQTLHILVPPFNTALLLSNDSSIKFNQSSCFDLQHKKTFKNIANPFAPRVQVFTNLP